MQKQAPTAMPSKASTIKYKILTQPGFGSGRVQMIAAPNLVTTMFFNTSMRYGLSMSLGIIGNSGQALGKQRMIQP